MTTSIISLLHQINNTGKRVMEEENGDWENKKKNAG